MVEKKIIQIQPFFLTPQPAEDCKFDWDYKFHGINWKCNCNEGLQQSPINIPPHDGLEYAEKPIKFEYNYLEANEIEAVQDRGIFRLRAKSGKSFGKITMPAA